MDEQQLRDAVREAMTEGMRAAMTDREAMGQFWDAAFEQLQARAQQQTGRLLLGGLGALARKATLFLALGLIVYTLGGWAGLVKLWHALG